jgi:hypothetical protein
VSEIEEGPEPQDEPVAVDAPVEPVERQIDPETVALAERYGWRPKDKSTLPEGSWMDAERFVAASKTQVRILNDRLGETSKKAEAAEALARTAADTVRRQERARYDNMIADIRQRKEAAVEASDVETYKRLDDAETRLRAQPQQDDTPPEVTAFFADEKHAWTKDPVLKAFMANAIDADPEIRAKPAIDQLRWAHGKAQEYFPHKFPPPEPPQPRDPEGRYATSKVDGGGLATGRTTSSGLDAQERADFARLKSRGVFKTEAEYIAYSKELGVRE